MKKLFVIAVVLITVFASCPHTPTETKGEIVFWIPFGSPSDKYLVEIVNKFNTTNPSMRVTWVQYEDSDEYLERLRDAIRDGNPPNVILIDRFSVAQRAAEMYLHDLTPYLNIITHDFLSFAWEETQFRERTYAIPFDADVRGLFYNRNILREAGFPIPIDTDTDELYELHWKSGPITLARLEEISRTVNEHFNNTKIGFIPQMDQGWHYTWGSNFGGEFADAAGRNITPTNQGVIAGFRFLFDWNNNMRKAGIDLNDFLSEYYQNQYNYSSHPFIRGNLAMTINGDWFMDIIERYTEDFDYGVTFIPIPEGYEDFPWTEGVSRPHTWTGGYAFAIPRGSRNTAEAMRFIEFASGPVGQRIYISNSEKLRLFGAFLSKKGFTPPISLISGKLFHLPETARLSPSVIPIGTRSLRCRKESLKAR